MASRPIDPSSRHVGRVVDPMVREDGESDPELSLDTGLPAPAVGEPTVTASDDTAGGDVTGPEHGPAGRGATVRERLLERARHAEPRPVTDAGHTEPTEPAQQAEPDDLDAIGRRALDLESREAPLPRAPGAPLGPARAALSPTVVALFGTLMGMAVIASVTAVAMHLAPHRETQTEIASAAPPIATAAAPAPPPREKPKKRERQRLPGPYRVSEGAQQPGLRLVEGKIGNEPFLKAVEAAGVPIRESYRIVTAFQGLRSFDRCKRTDRFVALLDRQSQRLKAFEYIVSAEEVYQAREGQSGLLEASKLDLKVERTQIAGSLVYDGKSFDDSAEASGFERGLARVVSRALDGHSSLDELERGDAVRLIVQEVSVLGEFARYAGVEALEVKRVKGDALRVYYFDVPEVRGYYDVRGRSPHEGGWRKPIPGAPITSHFNLKRMHPVLKKVMPHLGTDFGAPTGTPIGASAPGTVTFVGYSGPAGNLVKVEHAGGIETGYAHMSRFAEGIKVGNKVKRLEILGYVGSTGRSTGPHLHFSATKNKEYFDAEKLDLDGMRTLAGPQRLAFDALMAKYNPLLDAIALPEPLPEEAAPDPGPPADSARPAASVRGPPALGEPETEEEDSHAPPLPPLPAPPASGAPKRAGSSIYLTDKEL
ncbi:MAG TPA: M23 family metallopeptidase, partial [Polyangiaceae bacterium]